MVGAVQAENMALAILAASSIEPGLDPETARTIVDRAHVVCPYSNATRGNVDVTLTLA